MRKVDALKKLAEKLGIATAGTIKSVTDAINIIAEGISKGEVAEKTMFEVKEYMSRNCGVIRDDGVISFDGEEADYMYDNNLYTNWETTQFIDSRKGDEWNCVNAYGFCYDTEKNPIERFEGRYKMECDGFVCFCFLEKDFGTVKIQSSSPGELMSEYIKAKKEVENFEMRIKQEPNDGVGGIALRVGDIIKIQSVEGKKVTRMDLQPSKSGVVLEIYENWTGTTIGSNLVGTFSFLDVADPPDDVISEPIKPESSQFTILVKHAASHHIKDAETGKYTYSAIELISVTLTYEDGTSTTQRFNGSQEVHKDIMKLMTEIDTLKEQLGGGA